MNPTTSLFVVVIISPTFELHKTKSVTGFKFSLAHIYCTKCMMVEDFVKSVASKAVKTITT
jgi:alpha-D-ribose 1-methylphosphonate 5-triphosphate synthase subunit PhnI